MIRVKIACRGCGLKVDVDVPARDGEDVTTWLTKTEKVVERNHRHHSPLCWSKSRDVMIPVTTAIGAAPLQ